MERDRALPEGADERFLGYGVMAAPFQSGDVLAMRRFPASSLGHAYTSVWHRNPDGEWTFWSDLPPLEACPRYFGSAIAHALVAPIDVRWPEPERLEVAIPSAELFWSVELEATASTRLVNALGRILPDRLWRSPAILGLMGRLAGPLLHAGRLGLTGHTPNGQLFLTNPKLVWGLRSSTASIGGRILGPPGRLAEQAHLGDFFIPQRGLFAIGRAFFEPADRQRHSLIPQAVQPV